MSQEQRPAADEVANDVVCAVRDDAAVASAPERGDRRAALEQIGRWALVAPALAVLVDPEHAHAYLIPGGGD